MKNRPAHFQFSTEDALSVDLLARLAHNWFLEGELANHSQKTLKSRRDIVGKLLWFLNNRSEQQCGIDQLRAFFLYLQRGHNEPEGRWGNPSQRRPLRPLTIKTYYAYLRSFFSFCVQEGRLETSPMERIPAPRDPGDEVMPFTEGEIQALLKTARKSRYARRDTAILLVFSDTGMRAQELCNLRLEDVDFHQKKIMIHEGKGKKTRAVYLGKRATKALWDYVREDDRTEQDPLFLSEKGDYLTYDGLRQMLERLGERAGVAACRAHRFRHFFAVSFLRSGGNQFSLMRLLGHSTLSVTNRYVQLAQTDVERQHREHSPADRIGRV